MDDPSVVQIVSQSGTNCSIKRLRDGYATLTVTTQDGGKTAKCLISVSDIGVDNFKSDLRIPTKRINAGSFLMGCPSSYEHGYTYYEYPQHKVTLTKSFYMSQFDITNYQFAEFLNAKKVEYTGEYVIYRGHILAMVNTIQYNSITKKWEPKSGYSHYPIINVSWYGASEFAQWVGGRLPTEAEWEYACRAGTTTLFYWGDNPGQYINYVCSVYSPVGQKLPNAWGLYDMIGNARQWCADLMRTYTSQDQIDPVGQSGSLYVIRGTYSTGAQETRSSQRRMAREPGVTSDTQVSFRIVFDN